MYSTYTDLVKSAKKVFCNINWTLKFRSPDIRCHVAGGTVKPRMIKEEQHEVS